MSRPHPLAFYPSLYGDHPDHPTGERFAVTELAEGRLGLVSLVPFEPGAVMARIEGEEVPDVTPYSFRIRPGRHLVDLYFAAYLMHHCEPVAALDLPRRRLLARQPIRAGSLVTIDYMETEDRLLRPFACRCGAPTCRGRLGDVGVTPRPARAVNLPGCVAVSGF